MAHLAALARDYWRPIVAYLRASQRVDHERALDLAQSFFVYVMESDWLAKADPSRGRFRGFLKRALVNFAIDARRSEQSLRRGGGRRFVPLLAQDGDDSCDPTAPGDLAPEAALDREWRRGLVERAIADTRSELEATGRGTQYAAFAAYFLAQDAAIDYREIGARLRLSPAEVSNALQRCKRLFRDKLKARVIETVASADDLDAEWHWLFGGVA